MVQDQEVTPLLENIIQHLQDSKNGYKECASCISSQSMNSAFIALSKKREEMLDELKMSLKNEEIFNKDGTITGKLHQIFINLKEFVAGNDVDSILAEIKRGENILIESYKDALSKNGLPDYLSAILGKQLLEVENDLSKLLNKSFDVK